MVKSCFGDLYTKFPIRKDKREFKKDVVKANA